MSKTPIFEYTKLMTSSELRKKYLEFFKEKGHAIISGAPLMPEHDPTVLFTTAGMHPLVPYLLGEKHPAGKRLVDVQKCIRTGDIDEVGDDWHITFLEMLGNWSFGDYWKEETIEWSFEFLIKKLKIPFEKLSISCFAGDKDAPRDEESAKIWESLGIPKSRIKFLGREDNWWGPAGKTGPCGPDTEMFIDGVEVWNDVFMEYNKTAGGKFEALKQKNVDTGMGLERMIAVLNGYNNVYETELFFPIIKKIEEISGLKYADENKKYFRIIADHVKASTFILAEGLEPSNVERGYVLRRLVRRAVRYGKQLGISDIFTFKVADAVINIYRNVYPELKENKNFIEKQLIREEEKFTDTLERGLKEFEKLSKKGISGKEAFDLYQTYGFPFEITVELAKEKGVAVDEKEFNEELVKHQDLSRTARAGTFKSGLADHSEQVIKYHTAAHLMLAALRKILGEHVSQKGSNITGERLRFDFSHPEKMTPEQIKQVEDMVNEKIREDLPVKTEEMSLEDAKKQGAVGVFESKYGEKVKVYTIGVDSSASSESPFSREICGGPHVKRTGVLGKFKIIKEESSSAGVRRIKAVLE